MAGKFKLFDGTLTPKDLLRSCRRVAAIDGLLSPNAGRYRFEGDPKDHGVFRFDNGCGDHLFVLFSPDGTVIKGFDHESPLSPYNRALIQPRRGMYGEMPPKLFQRLKSDPSLEWESVTFCFWRAARDTDWWEGEVEKSKAEDDGSRGLLPMLCTEPKAFQRYAEEFMDLDLDVGTLKRLYAGRSPKLDDLRELAPKAKAPQLERAVAHAAG